MFDRRGHLEVTQAGDGRTASYAVAADSSLVPLGVSASSGGAALCWNVRVGSFLYGANAGSGTLTSWSLAKDGTTSVLGSVLAVVVSVAFGIAYLAAMRAYNAGEVPRRMRSWTLPFLVRRLGLTTGPETASEEARARLAGVEAARAEVRSEISRLRTELAAEAERLAVDIEKRLLA